MIERLEVTAGAGTVIRYGGIVAWADPSASAALISFLAQSARNLSPSPRGGRQIADHIAGVLATRDPEPHVAFAVVGPSDHGWASLLHGPVQAWDGARWLAPTPSPGWLQAIITPRPSITVSAAGTPTPAPLPDAMWDLEAGVVPGAGFVLLPAGVPGRFAVVRPVGEDQLERDVVTPDVGPPPEYPAEKDPEPSGEPVAAATTVLPAVEPTTMLAPSGPTTETTPKSTGASEPETGGKHVAGAAALSAAAAAAAVAAANRPPAPEPSTSTKRSTSDEPSGSTGTEVAAGTALAAGAGAMVASARGGEREPVVPAGPEPEGATDGDGAGGRAAAGVKTAAEPAGVEPETAQASAVAAEAPPAGEPEVRGEHAGAGTETAAAGEEPAADEQPAARAVPAAGEEPAAGVEPAAGEEPAAPAKPAAGVEPAAGEEPADTGGPAGTEAPAVAPPPEPEPPPPPRKPRLPGPPGSLDLRTVATTAGAPLARGGGPDQRIPGAPVVAGTLCARGHLNRPGLTACARCRTSIPDGVKDQVSGTRPPLGVLVSDDGTIYRLDHGYLVGSASGRDPTVGGGLARPLTLQGSDISGSHAELRLVDWDVLIVDRGSAAGTCVFEPGAKEWARLNPYEPHVLQPGTHVAFGQRVVTFLSPWVISG